MRANPLHTVHEWLTRQPPFLVRGCVPLEPRAPAADIMDAMVEGLTRRLSRVERTPTGVQFSVAWAEGRSPSLDWLSAVDGGRLWIAQDSGREVCYELYAVRSRLLVPPALVVGTLGLQAVSPSLRVVLVVGGSLVLLLPSHWLAVQGARRFLAECVRTTTSPHP